MAIKHTIRKDGNGKTKTVNLTRGSAIRAFCFECMGFNSQEVYKCTDTRCSLYPYRNYAESKITHDKGQEVLKKAA